MSALLVAHAPFLSLLLTTELAQQKAILKTLTQTQQRVLLEVLHNIGTLPHRNEDLPFLKKRKRLLKLFNKNNSIIKRKLALKRNTNKVLGILHRFKDQLLSLL